MLIYRIINRIPFLYLDYANLPNGCPVSAAASSFYCGTKGRSSANGNCFITVSRSGWSPLCVGGFVVVIIIILVLLYSSWSHQLASPTRYHELPQEQETSDPLDVQIGIPLKIIAPEIV